MGSKCSCLNQDKENNNTETNIFQNNNSNFIYLIYFKCCKKNFIQYFINNKNN